MLSCYFEDKKLAHLRHVTVDALIEKDGQILLIKRSSEVFYRTGEICPARGIFRTWDESAAEAVVREVLEETGYQARVKALFRIMDKPRLKGDDRQNVGFFFIVEVLEQVQQPDEEITSIHWFEIKQLPPAEKMGFDHADNLKLFLEYLKKPWPLPLFN